MIRGSSATIPVILDCDPGHDDALALILAATSPNLELIGITTVAGNGGLERVTENALRVCALAGIEGVRVARGASHPILGESQAAVSIHGESALDGAELPLPKMRLDSLSAVELMANLVSTSRQQVMLIATGPLTNIATFISSYPHLKSKIAGISFMGGSTERGNWTPLAEFNIWADPEAADIVVTAGIPTVMIGLNVTHKALVTEAIIQQLQSFGTTIGKTVASLLKFFAKTYQDVFAMPDPPLHDPLAVLAVSRPELFTFIETNVSIEMSGTLTRGATVVDLHRVTGRASNVNVAIDVDVEAFWKLMLEAIRMTGERK